MLEMRPRYRLVEPAQHFDAGVDLEVQAALLSITQDAYKTSHAEAVAKYATPLARTYCGHKRVAELETAMLGLANRFPGMTARLAPNSVGSHHHVEFRSRDVVIAVSKTRGPLQLPKWSRFRGELYASNTLGLFDEPAGGDEPLFCLLLHGTFGPSLASEPDFVTIVYPLPWGTGIAGAIDLKARFGAAPVVAAGRVETDEKLVGGLKKGKRKKIA